MTDLPSFRIYNGRGANALCFTLGNMEVFFSYHTPIAFSRPGELCVRENDWSNTTGRHLNAIDGGDKASRVPSAEFEKRLQEALNKE